MADRLRGGWARMSFVVEAKQERGSGAEEKGEAPWERSQF